MFNTFETIMASRRQTVEYVVSDGNEVRLLSINGVKLSRTGAPIAGRTNVLQRLKNEALLDHKARAEAQ